MLQQQQQQQVDVVVEHHHHHHHQPQHQSPLPPAGNMPLFHLARRPFAHSADPLSAAETTATATNRLIHDAAGPPPVPGMDAPTSYVVRNHQQPHVPPVYMPPPYRNPPPMHMQPPPHLMDYRQHHPQAYQPVLYSKLNISEPGIARAVMEDMGHKNNNNNNVLQTHSAKFPIEREVVLTDKGVDGFKSKIPILTEFRRLQQQQQGNNNGPLSSNSPTSDSADDILVDGTETVASSIASSNTDSDATVVYNPDAGGGNSDKTDKNPGFTSKTYHHIRDIFANKFGNGASSAPTSPAPLNNSKVDAVADQEVMRNGNYKASFRRAVQQQQQQQQQNDEDLPPTPPQPMPITITNSRSSWAEQRNSDTSTPTAGGPSTKGDEEDPNGYVWMRHGSSGSRRPTPQFANNNSSGNESPDWIDVPPRQTSSAAGGRIVKKTPANTSNYQPLTIKSTPPPMTTRWNGASAAPPPQQPSPQKTQQPQLKVHPCPSTKKASPAQQQLRVHLDPVNVLESIDGGDVTSTTTGLDLDSVLDAQTSDDDDAATDMTDTQAIRRQLEGLETMYGEVLKLLGVNKKGKHSSVGLRRRALTGGGSVSSLPSSVSSRPIGGASMIRDKRSRSDDKKKVKDIKGINKRFQRLESHVVTLARSVAHLSSEMRTQHAVVQEIENIHAQLATLRGTSPAPQQPPATTNSTPPHSVHQQQPPPPQQTPQAAVRCRSVPSSFRVQSTAPFQPSTVKKLTNFFGDEPPLLRIFLRRLGYEKYAGVFETAKVGVLELPHMTEERLESLGIPLGPRLRIMQEARENLLVATNAAATTALSPPKSSQRRRGNNTHNNSSRWNSSNSYLV